MGMSSFFASVSIPHEPLAKSIAAAQSVHSMRYCPLHFLKSLLLIIAILAGNWASAQTAAMVGNIIQITGVTMTADSLRAVGGVEIVVKGKDRGVESSRAGVFSIVV